MISAGALIRTPLMGARSQTTHTHTHTDAYVYVYVIANVMAACVQIKSPFLCSLFRSVINQINRQTHVGERRDYASPLVNSVQSILHFLPLSGFQVISFGFYGWSRPLLPFTPGQAGAP